MNAREILQAVAVMLCARGHNAALRFRWFELNGERAAVIDGDRIHLDRVRGLDSAVLMPVRTVRGETAEDIAREMEARSRLVAAVEHQRRERLTPEQRAAEDHVCATCGLRDPLPGQDRCGRCEAKAA